MAAKDFLTLSTLGIELACEFFPFMLCRRHVVLISEGFL